MKKDLVHICFLLGVLYLIKAEECEPPNDEFPNGEKTVFNSTRVRVHYKCTIGYILVGESKQVCGDDGKWQPKFPPKCLHPQETTPKCNRLPYALHSKIIFRGTSLYHEVGDTATIICDQQYTTTGGRYKESFQIVCGADGKWAMSDGTKPILACTIRRCPLPPTVPNALYHYSSLPPLMGEGSRVLYTCQPKYVLVDSENNYLTCQAGNWEGSIPTCVRKAACSSPRAIHNGHWHLVKESGNEEQVFGEYKVGSKIQYRCDIGYKAIGSIMLECTDNHLWSKVPPICVYTNEPNWYCPTLRHIEHGVCKCAEENSSNNLELCEPFERGVEIQCMCDKGYTLVGASHLKCTQNNNKGVWDEDVPYCLTITDDIGVASGQGPESSDSSSSNDGTDVTNHVSTLVIVIATACSVLGVLLLVMVIVVFRRKKQRPHLFHPGMTPTPYSRVHISSIDDHDRVALMAYADATRVHLPTYEEAMQQGQFRPSNSTATTPTSAPQGSEYRPLPNIPPTIRNIHTGLDSNRHSSVTTSTMNRDGTSEIFGSLDTVNVSMSDASTSGETFDSGTSTRSISSQRATAGSLMSSADNLANDDARLLDNRSENMTELVTQTPIEEKED
ncbi:complement receptor type 1 isoform X2 [Patella vulgata]|uniref:complement receptor type 1 isoform X2 n=1 Tax=Patella vulgata TaxID=6465 RepID=UPI00217FAEDA|nr:complement receptor type 1 isoform X2 [Patella vulgata]